MKRFRAGSGAPVAPGGRGTSSTDCLPLCSPAAGGMSTGTGVYKTALDNGAEALVTGVSRYASSFVLAAELPGSWLTVLPVVCTTPELFCMF